MTWSHRNVVLFILYLVFILKCFTKPFIIKGKFNEKNSCTPIKPMKWRAQNTSKQKIL